MSERLDQYPRRPAVLPLALVLAVGCSVATPGSARTMQQKLERACAADIDRLCAAATPDPDKVKACMLTRRAEVSRPCIELLDASE